MLTTYSSCCFSFSNNFYCLRNDNNNLAKVDIIKNHRKISKLIIQTYFIDRSGNLSGTPNKKIVSLANTYKIPVLAQLTNVMFEMVPLHNFLKDKSLQKKAINQIVIQLKRNGFSGLQLDFEHINISDKEKYNNFILNLNQELHKNQLILHVAVIPPISDDKDSNFFLNNRYLYWYGAYDLNFLSKHADFIDLMTYDQHSDWSTPGPVAGYTWVKYVLEKAVKQVPKEKLIIGIPTYSLYWRLKNFYYGDGNRTSINQGVQITYNAVKKYLNDYPHSIYWNSVDKLYFAILPVNHLYQYLFIEDERAISELLKLAKKYKTGGVGVFRLGIEDPKMWRHF